MLEFKSRSDFICLKTFRDFGSFQLIGCLRRSETLFEVFFEECGAIPRAESLKMKTCLSFQWHLR